MKTAIISLLQLLVSLPLCTATETSSGGDTGRALIEPRVVNELPRDVTTIAELLKAAGYITAHFGKWHVGRTDPRVHGFDESAALMKLDANKDGVLDAQELAVSGGGGGRSGQRGGQGGKNKGSQNKSAKNGN